jgi:hypothetical protein
LDEKQLQRWIEILPAELWSLILRQLNNLSLEYLIKISSLILSQHSSLSVEDLLSHSILVIIESEHESWNYQGKIDRASCVPQEIHDALIYCDKHCNDSSYFQRKQPNEIFFNTKSFSKQEAENEMLQYTFLIRSQQFQSQEITNTKFSWNRIYFNTERNEELKQLKLK